MLRTLFFILITTLPLLSHGECNALAEKLVAEQGYVDRPEFIECKIWSVDPSKTIIALAVLQRAANVSSAANNDAQAGGLYDLDILVMHTSNGKLLHRLLQKGELYSDADYLSSVTIDTGRYDLAQGVRAFGVRASNSHSGGVSIEEVSLSLYAIQKGGLFPVTDRMIVRSSVTNPVTSDCYDSRVKVRTISVGKRPPSGYADLQVNEKQEHTEVTIKNNTCDEATKKIVRHHVLRFDGGKYQLPPDLHD